MHLSIHIPPVHESPSSQASREYLFFDESVTGLITVDSAANAFDLVLDVSIVPGDIFDTDPKFHLHQFLISSEPVTNVVESTETSTTYSFTLPVHYPRRKLANPKIVFKAYTKSKPESLAPQPQRTLPNFVAPTETNLVEELTIANMHVGGSIIEKKTESQQELKQPEKELSPLPDDPDHVASISLPIYSALVIRLKSTKPAGKNTELLTSFNIEASDQLLKLGPRDIQLNQFEINFSGSIVDLNDQIYKFPIFFGVQESVNLNFRLVNGETDDLLKQLTVSLEFVILNHQKHAHSVPCSNTVNTTWSPFVDFNLVAPPISNSLKYTQPQQKKKFSTNHNASSTMVFKKNAAGSASNASLTTIGSPSVAFPISYRKQSSSSSNITINLTNNVNSGNLYGLKLTFSGKLSIKLGEIVSWRLQAINGTNNRLSLSLVSHSSNQQNQLIPPQNQPHAQNGQQTQIPTSVPPHHLLQAYRSLQSDNNGILVLDTDIRIGPLEPNTVFETDLKLMGLARGIYNLDGLNIFDLATGDGLDFGKLVDVFVT